jgi:hypothetical protein
MSHLLECSCTLGGRFGQALASPREYEIRME